VFPACCSLSIRNRTARRNQSLGLSPDVSIRLIVSDGKRTLKE
jgi:hypothetical protein